MEKEGLVEIHSIEKTGNRSKAIYKVMTDGEKEFETLLLESLQVSPVLLPSNLYTDLNFIQYLTKSQVIESLKNQQVLIRRTIG